MCVCVCVCAHAQEDRTEANRGQILSPCSAAPHFKLMKAARLSPLYYDAESPRRAEESKKRRGKDECSE